MAYQLKCKRGIAYKCMHCIYPESFLAEKTRVEAHILKRHMALDKARYYCTLCMFRCNDKKNLDRHLVSFVPHLRQKELQIANNTFLGDFAYLKESQAPYNFNSTIRDYVPLSPSESTDFWATKSRGEQMPPLVSLPLPHTSNMSNPVRLPHAYQHMATMAPPTSLASIPPSYQYMPSMTPATLGNLPPTAYQYHPNVSSTIPSHHFLSPTMSQLPTAIAPSPSHLPVQPLFSTATATCQPPQSNISSAITCQMPATNHLFTAEPLEQPFNTPSPSAKSTITTCTAELASYLPIDHVDDYEAFSPEIGSPTRQVLEREVVAMAQDQEGIESILPQLLGQDPPSNCSNLNVRNVISTIKPKIDDDLSHQFIQALTNVNKSQQVILQELGHLNKSVTTLSSDISFLRGQFRQQERIINRQQRLLDRLNNTNNFYNRITRPTARTTPYIRPTVKRTQKKQMKSVVVKDT